MSGILMVSPSSGDSSASIFSGPDAKMTSIGTLNKGTMLKQNGSSGNFYEVGYDNPKPNIASGGTAMTGCIAALPSCDMWKTNKKDISISKINNGTLISIIDDTNPAIYQVSAITTDGNYTGWVETKFIFRDTEETPITRSRSMIQTMSSKHYGTGQLRTGSSMILRSSADASSSSVGRLAKFAKVNITGITNGWYKVDGKSDTGENIEGYILSCYISVDESNVSAYISKTDGKVVITDTNTDQSLVAKAESVGASNIPTDSYLTNFKNYSYNAADGLNNDEYYYQLSTKYANALGMPPKYNVDIDPQYIDQVNAGGGRVVSKTLFSNPAIMSLCPGKVKMFPDLLATEQDQLFGIATTLASGNDSLLKKITQDEANAFSSKMYTFNAATAEYATYLNTLCRATAIMLGIGDKNAPDVVIPLKNMDYAYWTIRKKYNYWGDIYVDNDTSIFRNFWPGNLEEASSVVDAAVSDNTYINFFVMGGETSVAESITSSVEDSPLDAVLNVGGNVGNYINYFLGSGFSIETDDATDAIEAILGTNAADAGAGIMGIGNNILKGGKMALPKMLGGSSYGKSINVPMKFVSPYGDPYSVFIKCLLPICHLLAMALPKQLSDNMYSYPFVVRGTQIGCWTMDLGVISSITITRGGSDDTAWTIDGLATEWDVQLELTPLIDDLMVTSTSHPFLFVKNEGLLDYLANFCGFDMLACNIDTKIEMMSNFFKNVVTDIPQALGHKVSDSLYNAIAKYATFNS